ncbi:acetyltransferase [Photobacterium profundum]|uniref:Probable acetyltransferase n=1 Tax=Photobacterium profundum 3TCK TaxID=314280 RepID=Q1Z614_9GAMM|nr:DapH/DapD/GlmU-related protein [Photobacterium profundum]EAS44030.1 probable acetyltransferase [Photobacterium profundum 3TCK]PSV61780.1 acetyltransferase [Photobacterium profundum]
MSQPATQILDATPSVAPDSKLHSTTLGRWTEIAERCILNNVTVGDYSYIQNDCNLMFTEVGKFTSIAASVRINPSNHPWWRPTLHHFTYRPGKFQLGEEGTAVDDEIFDWREEDKVVIGHDVWIGHGAIVLPGVSIGNGAIVGAGSVVTKDVPPWTIVVGNPARVLRPRFESHEMGERLEALAWWDWSDDKLKQNLSMFREDTADFLTYAEAMMEKKNSLFPAE